MLARNVPPDPDVRRPAVMLREGYPVLQIKGMHMRCERVSVNAAFYGRSGTTPGKDCRTRAAARAVAAAGKFHGRGRPGNPRQPFRAGLALRLLFVETYDQ
jgi:hypothetical protein